MDVEYYICSSTKSNPSKTIETDPESNHFECLKLDSNYNGEIKPTTTYNNFKMLTLCKKKDASNINIDIKGHNGYDLIEG